MIRADGSIKALSDIDKVSGFADALEKKAKVAGKADGGFISVMAIKNTLSIADSYGQMSARIKLAVNDMSEYDYVQNRLLKTANATQRSLPETQSYSSIQVGTSEISGTP